MPYPYGKTHNPGLRSRIKPVKLPGWRQPLHIYAFYFRAARAFSEHADEPRQPSFFALCGDLDRVIMHVSHPAHDAEFTCKFAGEVSEAYSLNLTMYLN